MMRARESAGVLLLMMLLWVGILPAEAAPLQQAGDYDIPNGHFFTQTAGGQGGFSVMDDGEARFWAEFQRLGGLQTVGYPISRRFVYDGFVTQAFQKLVLQWRPEVGQAWPVNVFDELSEKGFDDALLIGRQTPRPLENFDPIGASWPQVVAARQGLLDGNAAIRARYFSVSDPLNVFGLPTSRVEDMGNHYAVRTQRAVFQQWKETVPWAAAGQVTIANGGDIAKELGWLSGPSLTPEPMPIDQPAPSEPFDIVSMAVAPGDPGRVYALSRQMFTDNTRLRYSDNLGKTWTAFPGQLPACSTAIDLDYQTGDALFASTCNGLFRWTGSRWELLSAQIVHDVSVAYGQPNRVWVAAGTGGGLMRSDDGGRTLRQIDQTYFYRVGVDPRDNAMLYGVVWGRYSPPIIGRAGVDGGWTAFPYPEGRLPLNKEITIDGQTGEVYATTFASMEGNSALWRITNPRDADVNAIRWEKVHDFGQDVNVELLASGRGAFGAILFANLFHTDASAPTETLLSLDNGQTWQQVTP